MLFAHGVGTRSDLPVSLAVIGAGMALMISFVVLAALWRGPRLHRDVRIPLPRVLTRMADTGATRIVLQRKTVPYFSSVFLPTVADHHHSDAYGYGRPNLICGFKFS